jgi:hypothetical protein
MHADRSSESGIGVTGAVRGLALSGEPCSLYATLVGHSEDRRRA